MTALFGGDEERRMAAMSAQLYTVAGVVQPVRA